MDPCDATLAVETWQFRETHLPRVPPHGWATTNRLREAVCLAVACTVDGVEDVTSFEGPATERERFDATVTTDSVDHELVCVVSIASDASAMDEPAPSESSTAGAAKDGTSDSSAPGDNRDAFEQRTEQFDLDEALDRL